MKLSGKVATITGAARGIGKACAKRFLDDGVKVVISDVDADGLHATAAELGRPDALALSPAMLPSGRTWIRSLRRPP